MKIALPIWDHRVSPVFDVARHVLVVEIGPRGMTLRKRRPLPQTDAVARAQALTDWGVEVLICGAISQEIEHLLRSRGVAITSRVCGDVSVVLEAYLAGRLDQPEFAMPGCQVAAGPQGEMGPRRTQHVQPSE